MDGWWSISLNKQELDIGSEFRIIYREFYVNTEVTNILH